MTVSLGGFVFTDYAIPERIKLGGEQNLVVHKLIGGTRVINAMGPDNTDLTWSGRFQGPTATPLAVTLDQMRKSASVLPLIMDTQTYTVVIKNFDWTYERSYQILYTITCVDAGNVGGLLPFPSSLTSLISGDMALVGGLVSSITSSIGLF
jgi:hypothetical protein